VFSGHCCAVVDHRWSGCPRGLVQRSGIPVQLYTAFGSRLQIHRGAQNIVIAYTAGYSTTPPEVAQACIELVALRYRERTRIGEVSRSLGGAETVAYGQKDMSDAIKTLLQQYRLVAPIAPIQQTPAVSATDATIISGVL